MTKELSYKEILESLEKMFPGKLLLSIKETSGVLGIKPQTMYNGICKGADRVFPIKPVRMRGPKIRVHDLARYLVELD
ncbi:hypothetical protein H8E88_04480 [candidate division KSB1 bacterium]|nr:hypothetical protein [candidate division KSB1 bacterium]